jgi:hypothetical protein
VSRAGTTGLGGKACDSLARSEGGCLETRASAVVEVDGLEGNERSSDGFGGRFDMEWRWYREGDKGRPARGVKDER